jgi:elongator complex protein 1
MTRNFDLIHEEPLRQEHFGEGRSQCSSDCVLQLTSADKFINVGWGSKMTQFHGSLGKAAAKEPTASISSSSTPTSLAHPTDDGLPHITFRGDAAFFAVSSLDPYSHSPDYARRQVRIYSRDSSAGFAPKLSATSESLPGLEGPLAWRPSGNVISGLVRYGYMGGGAGKEGRWEVAMLERNGLRHGGFPLRERENVWKEGNVRAMGWNADSEVLAIWIQRKEEDVGASSVQFNGLGGLTVSQYSFGR